MTYLQAKHVAALGFGCAIWFGMTINGPLAEASDFDSYDWEDVNPASSWEPRAGLEAVELGDAFYLMGGRTPIDPNVVPVFGASTIWGDVWKSVDRGESWSQILATDAPDHWAARGLF